MPIFGLSTGRKVKLYAVIDVGSHLIRALIFEKRQDSGVPKVIKKMVIKLPATYDKERVFIRLKELVFAMVKELERVPEKIIVGLGPHLVEHSLKFWKVKHPDAGKKITRKDLGTYFQNLFEQNRDKNFSSISYPMVLLVNGYIVKAKDLEDSGKPLTVLANDLELSFGVLFLSFSNEVGKILADIKGSLGGMPIEFVPLVAVFKEATKSALGLEDAFLIDVGGEETTLVFLKDGELQEVVKFPLGARHFLREIARIASVSFEEAEDVKRQYVQGLMDESKKKELNEFLLKEAGLWKKMFVEALDSFYKSGPLPASVFLFGGGAYLPEISSVLRESDWIKSFSHFDSTNLKVVEGSSFFEGNTCGGFIKGPEDVGVAALVLYALNYEPAF